MTNRKIRVKRIERPTTVTGLDESGMDKAMAQTEAVRAAEQAVQVVKRELAKKVTTAPPATADSDGLRKFQEIMRTVRLFNGVPPEVLDDVLDQLTEAWEQLEGAAEALRQDGYIK